MAGTIQKRACDGCHRRKVKCDSNSPCRNCNTANIQCTYNAIPQKKGPKGSRAKVISELRETQRLTSLPVKVQARMSGVPTESIQNHNATNGLLTAEFAKSCLNFFFDNLYSKLPILDRDIIESQLSCMERDPEIYCLFTSLCAFMMLQPGMGFPTADYNLQMEPGANIAASNILVEECLRVRKGTEHWENPSHYVLATNYFIFAFYYSQQSHASAWYYLREATTMIQMSDQNNEGKYLQDMESIRRRRLYWLLFNAERAYAIQRSYPLTLQATVHMGNYGEDPADNLNPSIQTNFFNMCSVFQSIDDNFLSTWRHPCCRLDNQIIASLDAQLLKTMPTYHPNAALQAVQSWLKTVAWQTSGDTQENVAYRMSQFVSGFPNPAMLMNSGLIAKLLQVTSDLIYYLVNAPQSRNPTTQGPERHLQTLLRICLAIQSNHYQFVPLLLSKVNDYLPRIIDPMLLNPPENVGYGMSVDIFDGFGNAGMAQMPMGDYNSSLPMNSYEPKYEDMGGNSPDSLPHSHHSHHSNGSPPGSQMGNEMPQNFVSSPGAVMSPGMDYTPNMGGFSISDMVMSPLGGAAPPNGINMQRQQQQQQLNNQPQMQGMPNQGIGAPPMNQNIGSLYSGVRQPSRQSSFNMQGQTPLSAMGSMSDAMDFNTLPPR
ncbi:hypothetical protein FPSE_05173 [Fusarium pseudograminearum CS3096]|uniref:Zn(2)-C6 fungal-type domain-containing protein n=1 Tax=Fusarium pseudograminearum (strain CS3096) TaxID=1028729 RepID=K3W0T4_FUSPC|nr:hypothetical protein FPSE_05173 [Fusarium pseudograminearum CS3096]EKJ74705.1 hypothetical protein FPSE_05173 [Fusarium pseudograminearum CS3096]KAF0636794.1 hypothetical protein FPSE5266_05173 [Fusarium pseudograminearum]